MEFSGNISSCFLCEEVGQKNRMMHFLWIFLIPLYAKSYKTFGIDDRRGSQWFSMLQLLTSSSLPSTSVSSISTVISLWFGISLLTLPLPPPFCPLPHFMSLSLSLSAELCLSPSSRLAADHSEVVVWGHRRSSCSIWMHFLPSKLRPDETTHEHRHSHTYTPTRWKKYSKYSRKTVWIELPSVGLWD